MMKRIVLSVLAGMVALMANAQGYEESAMWGKKIAVFGGSFSEIPASEVTKAYWSEKLNCKVTTYGIGGAGFSAKTGEDRYFPVQIDRALASDEKYDMFIIWASTNDVSRGATVAEQDSMIRVCVAKLRKAAPKAKVIFFGSLPVPLLEHVSQEEVDAAPNDFARRFLSGMKNIPLFVEGQAKTCEELGVPFLNLYDTSGINEWNAPDFFGRDRLHLNTEGYNHIKELQARFIAAQ